MLYNLLRGGGTIHQGVFITHFPIFFTSFERLSGQFSFQVENPERWKGIFKFPPARGTSNFAAPAGEPHLTFCVCKQRAPLRSLLNINCGASQNLTFFK